MRETMGSPKLSRLSGFQAMGIRKFRLFSQDDSYPYEFRQSYGVPSSLGIQGDATMKSEPTDFQKFDAAVVKMLSVSHDELKRREVEWKEQRKAKRETVLALKKSKVKH
jgi:hypothetical protein